MVTLSSLVGYTSQVGVSLFTVLSYNTAVIVRILPQETLRIVVAVDVDLGQSVMGGGLLTAFVDARLQPRQQQLQSVRGTRKPDLGLYLFLHVLNWQCLVCYSKETTDIAINQAIVKGRLLFVTKGL